MKQKISWTEKLEGGVKREVRVTTSKRALKWQFKQSDEECWDYDSLPTPADWDALEDILRRRAGRGRTVELCDVVRKLRAKAGG